ncbi:MAG: tRNA pseudouridine(38-40) synthase TruA [Thiohalomonadales bacterium]
MRIALGVEYDGSDYCGWQYQDHSPSVQSDVEQALSRVADEKIRVICAGRTDTGVHARNQVVHFDTTASRSDRAWVFGANTHLKDGIAVLWACSIDDTFHARFSAIRRSYRYIIFNRRIRPTFLAKRVTWEYRELDSDQMQLAASHLIGNHDFNAYRSAACQAKSSEREILHLDVHRQKEFVIIDVVANAFLHHMVRNIAGVLISIGAGEHPPRWSQEILFSKDRTLAAMTAKPFGLYLMDIRYPPEFMLPQLEDSLMLW